MALLESRVSVLCISFKILSRRIEFVYHLGCHWKNIKTIVQDRKLTSFSHVNYFHCELLATIDLRLKILSQDICSRLSQFGIDKNSARSSSTLEKEASTVYLNLQE